MRRSKAEIAKARRFIEFLHLRSHMGVQRQVAIAEFQQLEKLRDEAIPKKKGLHSNQQDSEPP